MKKGKKQRIFLALVGVLLMTGILYGTFEKKNSEISEKQLKVEQLEEKNGKLEGKKWRLEGEKSRLEDQNKKLEEMCDNLILFLKLQNSIQDICYTKIDKKKKEVLFVDIPTLPEGEFPIFLNPKNLEVERGTELYVSFSGLGKNWILREVRDWADQIAFVPYRVENNTYYSWKLESSGVYHLKFELYNGEEYELSLYWTD